MSLLGIDIGTSCCKASLFGDDGTMIHCARRRYELQRDNSGGVVLPSEEVWRKIREVIAEAASKVAGSDPVEALCAASMTMTPPFSCTSFVSFSTGFLRPRTLEICGIAAIFVFSVTRASISSSR